MTPSSYLTYVHAVFQENGDPARAQGQMRYMRNQFEHFGLRNSEMRALSRQIIAEKGVPESNSLKELVRLCFQSEYREVHYFGLELVDKVHKKQGPEFIDFLEELITTRSWWDTVDWIVKYVGYHFRKNPQLIIPVTERWMASGNFWLQRVCLIFQLGYKEKTDFELMKKYILQLAGSKEFFLQKGAGWALRQYSKTNPEGVAAFIGNNPQLAPLTRREGLKWLKNHDNI